MAKQHEYPRYDRLPGHMQAGARRYIEQGLEPGHFLRNVLANDLVGAVSRADSVNKQSLPEWAMWLHNDIPSGAWGSEEKVIRWIEMGGLQGLEAQEKEVGER